MLSFTANSESWSKKPGAILQRVDFKNEDSQCFQLASLHQTICFHGTVEGLIERLIRYLGCKKVQVLALLKDGFIWNFHTCLLLRLQSLIRGVEHARFLFCPYCIFNLLLHLFMIASSIEYRLASLIKLDKMKILAFLPAENNVSRAVFLA